MKIFVANLKEPEKSTYIKHTEVGVYLLGKNCQNYEFFKRTVMGLFPLYIFDIFSSKSIGFETRKIQEYVNMVCDT